LGDTLAQRLGVVPPISSVIRKIAAAAAEERPRDAEFSAGKFRRFTTVACV
jgi:hypothetical protein